MGWILPQEIFRDLFYSLIKTPLQIMSGVLVFLLNVISRARTVWTITLVEDARYMKLLGHQIKAKILLEGQKIAGGVE